MNLKLTIFIFVFSISFQKDFMCSHIFEKEYIVFWLRNEAPIYKITNKNSETIEWGCKEIDIPKICGVDGKANFIYYKKNEPCMILKSSRLKFESLKGAYDQKTISILMKMDGENSFVKNDEISKNTKQIKLEFKVWQSSGDQIEKETIPDFQKTQPVKNENNFVLNQSEEDLAKFLIDLHPIKISFFKLTFLQALRENSVIAMIVFLTFGIILCFFGLKFYRDMLMFFIPLIMVLLGFYLYMTIVEKNVDQNNKMMLILITLLCLGAFVALAVTFTNIIYLILCDLNSICCKLSIGNRCCQINRTKNSIFCNSQR